jgi:hypothetical protein
MGIEMGELFMLWGSLISLRHLDGKVDTLLIHLAIQINGVNIRQHLPGEKLRYIQQRER